MAQPSWLRYAWAGVGIVFALVYAVRPLFQSERRGEPKAAVTATDQEAKAQSPDPKLSETRLLAKRALAMIEAIDSSADDFAAAETLIKRALELDATDGFVWAVSSRIQSGYLTRGFERGNARREAARSQAEKAVKLAPDSPEAWLALGRGIHATDPARAEEAYRHGLTLAPQDGRLLLGLGSLYRTQGRMDEALVFYEQAAARPETRALGFYDQYLVHFYSRRYSEADRCLREAIRESKSSNMVAGQAMLEVTWHGDTHAAWKILNEAPAAMRGQPRLVLVTALIALMARQPEEALRALDRLPADYINDAWFTGPKALLVGLAHRQADRPEAARIAWNSGITVVRRRLEDLPNDPESHLRLGELLAWTGQVDAALQEARAFSELVRSRLTDWTYSTVRIHAALGRADEALPMLEKLLTDLPTHSSRWPLSPALLRLDPLWDKLREDPRCQKLCEEPVGLKTEDSAPIDQKSVAVLAFANLSDDKGNEYFSDGISEELLNVLAKIPGLKVSARTSAFYFKGKEVPVPEIARQLGVAYVVEGSVRKQGDKVRITAQLIKAADGFHVWSDTFTRDLKDIFAVQDEIAGLIAKNLELKMGFAPPRPTIDLEAYQEYLAGRAAAAKAGNTDLREAVGHFEKAVAIEPKFTAAWVSLASAHTQLGRWGGAPTLASWAAARAAIDRAVALEPDLPDVLLALGWIRRTAEWDWRGAEQAFRRSLQLRPNHPDSLAGAAVLLFNIGQTEEAFSLGQQAARLDPLNAATQIDLSIMFYLNHNWREAEQSARRALQLAPGGGSYRSILGWSLTAQGRYDEAETEIARDNNQSEQAQAFGSLALARGQDAEARKWLARLEEIALTHGDSSDVQMNIAWLSVGLGDKDRAFAALERARASRDPSLSWLRNSWYLESLRSDPRWPVFLRKVGLADDQLK